MAQGLAEEVRQLLASGVPRTCTAMQAIGYKELAAAVASKGTWRRSREGEAAHPAVLKRQLTWFRRSRETQWYFWAGKPDFAAARHFATEKMEEYGVL